MKTGESGVSCSGHNPGHNGAGVMPPQVDGCSAAQEAGSHPHISDALLALQRFDWRARVRRHPYAMVATGAGIGYLLGGGLLSRPTARVLSFAAKVGARLVALPVIGDQLLRLVIGDGTGSNRRGTTSFR